MSIFSKSGLRPTILASTISLLLATPSHASLVRDDVDYQYFRDFAENKGAFAVGATNVPIYNKHGGLVGTALPNVPMLDLHVVNKKTTIATAISEQYINSVTHNLGYGTVQFGHEGHNPDEQPFDYQLVARNALEDKDYHVPRLHKLITEIAPVAVSSVANTPNNLQNNAYMDRNRFPYFVRVGSGTQGVRNRNNERTQLSGAYYYRTGGNPLTIVSSRGDWIDAQGSVFDQPLASYGMPGDSGSPLFAFDKYENRWVLVAVVSTYFGPDNQKNTYAVSRPDYIRQIKENDEIHLHNRGNLLRWQGQNGNSQITHSNAKVTELPLADSSLSAQDSSRERPSLAHGKTLHLSGTSGTLRLENDINQGAGALYFHNNFTVQGNQPNQIWQGAGVSVDKGSTVQWQVHNPQGDRLSKIGAGTLYVNGQGENLGDISVGDGTVVLAQRALNGKQQAFNQLGIVSGRPTVVLNDGNQVKPDNIYFGFRGGRLDLNGNSLSFQYIKNADEGARLVNHNPNKVANVRITGQLPHQAQEIEWREWGEQPESKLALYEYTNRYQGGRKDYFVLKLEGNPRHYFPTNADSSNSWEFLGSDRQTAIQTLLDRYNNQFPTRTFSGYLGENEAGKTNGALNVQFQPQQTSDLLMLNGGSQLNGNLTVTGGKLLLSGKPVPHARDMLKNQDVVKDDEWINRQFQANTFVAEDNGVLISGRNVERLQGNFLARNNSRLHLGFVPRRTVSCLRSDYLGDTQCDWQAVVAEQKSAKLPTTQIWGDVQLQDNSRLLLGKSHLHGNIQGSAQSRVDLASHSQWTLNSDSQIGSLLMENNSELTLNPQFEQANAQTPWQKFNRLTIENDLSGTGKIRYLGNVAEGKSDQIVVKGNVTGNFTLALKNTGLEPKAVSPIWLLQTKNSEKNDRSLRVELENGYVDLGTYRYVVAKQGNEYRLYNPLKEAQDAQPVASQAQFAQIQDKIQQQQKEVDRLNQQYQALQNSLKPLQTQLQTAQTKLAQLEQTAKRSPYYNRTRVPASFRQLLKQISNQRSTVQRLQTQFNQQNAPHASLQKALQSAQQSLASQQQQLQNLDSLALQEKALQLCNQQQLSASLCEAVVLENDADRVSDNSATAPVEEIAQAEAETTPQTAPQEKPQTKPTNNVSIVPRTEGAQPVPQPPVVDEGKEEFIGAENEEELITVPAEALSLENANVEATENLTPALAEAIAQVEPERAEPVPAETAQVELAQAEPEQTEPAQARSLSQPASSTRQADLISRYANTALSELSATTNASLQLGQNLDRQLLSDNMANVWVNQQWQKQTPSNDDHRPYEQSLQLTQIGVAQEVQPQWTIGAVLSHSRAQNSFDQGVSGKGNLTSLSFFSKKAWDNGIFASLDTSLGRANSQLDFDGERIRFHRNLFSLGANLGINLDKQWDLAGWKLQPSVGVRYYRLSGANYALEQAEIRQSALNLVAYNAGVRLSKAFDFKGLRIEPSLSSYYQNARHQSLKTESAMQVNKIALRQSFGNAFRHELALSMQYQQWQLHTHFGIEKGSHSAQQKYAGVKLGYSWK